MLNIPRAAATVAALVCALSLATTPAQQPTPPPKEVLDAGVPAPPPSRAGLIDDRALSFALCPIVYQVDHLPGPRGYRYLFYGDAFFINREGYLLTVAHVLSQLHGGQPYLLLRIANAPPRFVPAAVIALDHEHDVAILRATPNPFDSAIPFRVSTLPLAHDPPAVHDAVLLAALRPFRPRNAYTLDAALEERSAGEVISFAFSQLEKSLPDTQLFLFSHSVELGQSGAPVLSPDTQQVLGLVEGQWLRSTPTAFSEPKALNPGADADPAHAGVGAVIPITYALALLQQNGVVWRSGPTSAQ